MQPIITIFCAFTRGWAVDRWLTNLSQIQYDPKLINLCFIVDIDDPWLASRLTHVEDLYRGFKIQINRDWTPNEVRPIERRKRIAFIKEQSKALVKTFKADYVLGLEDDTVFENLDLDRWLTLFKMIPETGMVEGVQVGRWHKYMVGAWRFDDFTNPTTLETILPKIGHTEEIDAGGFYGYLITKANYLKIPYEYNNEVWGPDVNAGLWLRKNGYRNFIDWDINFGHNDHNQIIWPQEVELVKYKFMKGNEVWYPTVT